MERFGGFILFTLQWSLLTFTQFVLSPVTIVIIFVFDVEHDQNLQIAWQSLAHLHFGQSILATSDVAPQKKNRTLDRGVPRLKDQSKNLHDQSLGWDGKSLKNPDWWWLMNITGPQNDPYGSSRGVYHSEVGVGITLHYEWVLPLKIGISPTSNGGYTGYTGQVFAGVIFFLNDKAMMIPSDHFSAWQFQADVVFDMSVKIA